jgi:hypothetical protein
MVMSVQASDGAYPRAIGDSPPPSPNDEKKMSARTDNSLISTIDFSTEIVDPNRGSVKVELSCDDPARTKVIFPMGPLTMTAGAWPGEDYAAHGFLFKDGCWQFPETALPTRLEPQSASPKSPPPIKRKPQAIPQTKPDEGGVFSKLFKRFF